MARKKTPPAGPRRASRRSRAAGTRDDQYATITRLAIKHGETDKLVRHIMAAGLAAGPCSGDILARDLTLLRWCLKKMEDNRRMAEVDALEQQEG